MGDDEGARPQAAAWEDPMAGVDVERFGTTQFGTYTDAEWMLSQKIPLAAKISVAHGPPSAVRKRKYAQSFRADELSLADFLTENYPGAMEVPSNET